MAEEMAEEGTQSAKDSEATVEVVPSYFFINGIAPPPSLSLSFLLSGG